MRASSFANACGTPMHRRRPPGPLLDAVGAGGATVRADTEFADMRAALRCPRRRNRARSKGCAFIISIVYSRSVLGFDFDEVRAGQLKGASIRWCATIPAPAAPARPLYLASHAAMSSTGRCRRGGCSARPDRPCHAPQFHLSPRLAAA